MTTETIKVAEGVLNFEWEGRKLVKVRFDYRPLTEFQRLYYETATLDNCEFCGAHIEKMDAYWFDLTNNTICNYSPIGLHEPEPV